VSAPKHGWTDQEMDQVVGNLLRAGVLTAAAVVAVGAVLYLVQGGNDHPDYVSFKGEMPGLDTLPAIAAGAMKLQGQAVIQLGLLLLIATPVARVALLLFAFAVQRDRLYVLVTLVVLVVLIISLVGAEFTL
jgi:uncharacterized membrane protein